MLYSPDTFVTASHFHFNGRSRRQTGQQAEAKSALQLAVEQQALPFRGVEPGGLGKNRNPQELSPEINQFIAKLRGFGYQRWQW